jgi:hypothetical protein
VIAVSPDESTDWKWRDAYYDVEITHPSGAPRIRIAEGKVRVRPEVTR